MGDVNEGNAFPYEKTLLNTIVKNAKETKVIKYFKFIIYNLCCSIVGIEYLVYNIENI